MIKRPVIGAVSYLNTKPLVDGMHLDAPQYDLRFDLPSRLADLLKLGGIDVGLIPVVEAVSNPEYRVVSDACIGCRGPVWSVKLMSRVPPARIGSLALDIGSRTSCILTRTWLGKKYGVFPDLMSLEMKDDWQNVAADAVLIIGDRAMNAEDESFPYCWDLGQAWYDWTGKPFVFAVWAARSCADFDALSKLLSNSRDVGLSNLRQIAERYGPEYNLTDDESWIYLSKYLHFYLGDEERSGIEQFFRFAAELSLIPNNHRLNFHDFQTTG